MNMHLSCDKKRTKKIIGLQSGYVFTQSFDVQVLIENFVSACKQLCLFDLKVQPRDFATVVEKILSTCLSQNHPHQILKKAHAPWESKAFGGLRPHPVCPSPAFRRKHSGYCYVQAVHRLCQKSAISTEGLQRTGCCATHCPKIIARQTLLHSQADSGSEPAEIRAANLPKEIRSFHSYQRCADQSLPRGCSHPKWRCCKKSAAFQLKIGRIVQMAHKMTHQR